MRRIPRRPIHLDPWQRKANAWWASVKLTRLFLERIGVLKPLKRRKR